MDKQSLNEFLKKYSENCHTEQEHKAFLEWLNSASAEQVQEALEKYQQILETKADEEPVSYPWLVEKIEAKLNEVGNEEFERDNHIVPLWWRLRNIASVAAIFLVIAGLGLYLWMNRQKAQVQVIAKVKKDFGKTEIPPGGNKAILTLANGAKIVLDDAKAGVLATQSGINIRKTEDGQVIYDVSQAAAKGSELTYNTISTPRGGQYQVVLPDGSQVWLNAASSLKFPTVFRGKERHVELSGEAYFEVAKNKAKPFRVTSGNQTVEVLGTHFNINAYPEEANIKTTLLEGSVKVSLASAGKDEVERFLKPGQQAKTGADIQVYEVDVSQAIAWKNGYFVFSHENIESIMRKISRWYDVDIEYKGNITKDGFVGSVSKFEKVSEVLSLLELTGSVHFKIETQGANQQTGRRIIVMP